MLVAYKALIDDGLALSFLTGMVLEQERSPAANCAVTPQEVEARRAAVKSRGRSQS